jgi:hypothetical protein
VRPTLGALAALVTFWMLESQFLVRVEPPLTADVVGINCSDTERRGSETKIPVIVNPAPPDATTPSGNQQVEDATQKGKSSIDLTLVTLRAKEGKQLYLYMVVLLFAGFSGDKLLKTIADKVTMRLIDQAEKTRQAK